MKTHLFVFLTLLLLLFALPVFPQNWTEPVNISNMEGMDRQPDITIDGNGKIHCVWVHDIESNYTKIYYSSSADDGITWTMPEDISQNEEKWVGTPSIVFDSNDNLFLTYDFNVGDVGNTLILMKHYDGYGWSDADTVSVGLPGSRLNKSVTDMNNRLYCFWYHDMNYGTMFYRIYEDGQWGEIMEINTGNDYLFINEVKCDLSNRLHCIGAYHKSGETNNDDKVAYINMTDGVWSQITDLSSPTEPGKDIAVDSDNNPHIAFRQKSTPNDSDSTMYRHLTDAGWSEAELVVEDPSRQKILIDENNQPNIFDIEKTAEGTMLVHHFKNNVWGGFVVAESNWNSIHYSVFNSNYYLYAIYNKPDDNNYSEIYFTNTGIITGLTKPKNGFDLPVKIYPNPFRENIHIRIQLQAEEKIQARIYTMQGKLINTILDETKPPGEHELIWDGKNEKGSPVPGGLYLLRVRIGNYIYSRSVELIK